MFSSALTTLKGFAVKNERHLTVAALLAGFIVDNLTLTRIDVWFSHVILFAYLGIATTSIILLNAFPTGRFRQIMVYFMQYAFGGLFSGYIIFYSKSGTILANWPFYIILIILFFGNEYIKHRYRQMVFQIGILFVSVFSFFIFFIPIIVGMIGPGIFIVSGIVSLIFIRLVIAVIKACTPRGVRQPYGMTAVTLISIYMVFNLLYFTNIIPPIPLSLKDLGIYQSALRASDGDFIVTGEHHPWHARITGLRVQYVPGRPLYAFSSVFAPTKITGTITHTWLVYDEVAGVWVPTSVIPFSISGGRDDGYRGYSIKNNMEPGLWRVEVATERGQTLGRITFKAVPVDTLPKLETNIR